MKPTDDIKKFFKNAGIDTNPTADEIVLDEILNAHDKTMRTKSAADKRNIRRMIMKSRITKLAAAAVITIAVFAVINAFLGTTKNVVLANVLDKIEQANTYMYQTSTTITGLDKSSTTKESTNTVLISQDYGMKATKIIIDPDTGESTHEEMYLLPQQEAMVIVKPEKKAYVRMRLNDTMIERLEKEHSDPRTMIKQILSCEYTSLGKSVIDGITVEGFQTTDPAYTGSTTEHVDVKVWVDAETWLPMRSEMLIIDDTVHMHHVIDNFQWNVSVDAAEFEPVIPDDYTMAVKEISLPAFNEEIAIKGLRVYASLTGDYPDNLSGIAFMKELEELMSRGVSGSIKDLPPDEKAKIMKDIGMPVAGLSGFYQTLVQDKKDPAYYGQFVTPEEAEKVLMRWKISDDQYRVIFGDLTTETVTAEVLVELEKGLRE